MYYNRFNLDSLRKIEELDIKEINNSSSSKIKKLNKLSETSEQETTTTDTTNSKNNDSEDANQSKPISNLNDISTDKNELELAKLYNLKGLILIENGYFTRSQKYFKNASALFSNCLSNQLHPLLINNQYDDLYSNAYSTNDFESLKNNILELIAKSKLIENNYLVFKGYTYLSMLFAHCGNHRSAKALVKYSLNQLPKTLRKEFISNAIMLKCLLLYVQMNKNFKKDKFYQSYEKQLIAALATADSVSSVNHSKQNITESIADAKNISNITDNKVKSQIELEIFANKSYQEAEFSLSFNTLFFSMEKLNSAIKHLESCNYRGSNLALLYLKKWAIEILSGREATASFYLDESQRIINSSYSPDSYKNIEFLRSMIINSLNVYPPKVELAKEILRKTKKITDEVNCNSLQQKFLNIAVNLRTQTGVSEIFNLYEDILNTNYKYFKKDTEIMFDIKDMLKSSRLGFVYKNKEDNKQN